jgi:hypothetical protein
MQISGAKRSASSVAATILRAGPFQPFVSAAIQDGGLAALATLDHRIPPSFHPEF